MTVLLDIRAMVLGDVGAVFPVTLLTSSFRTSGFTRSDHLTVALEIACMSSNTGRGVISDLATGPFTMIDTHQIILVTVIVTLADTVDITSPFTSTVRRCSAGHNLFSLIFTALKL